MAFKPIESSVQVQNDQINLTDTSTKSVKGTQLFLFYMIFTK